MKRSFIVKRAPRASVLNVFFRAAVKRKSKAAFAELLFVAFSLLSVALLNEIKGMCSNRVYVDKQGNVWCANGWQ